MSIVAEFKVAYTRFLDPSGQAIAPLPAFAEDPQALIKLYRLMVLTRVFDNKAVALQRTGKLGTYPATLGQEAIAVAIGATMQLDDVLCPAYRENGAQLQRGVTMTDILAYWGGTEQGSHFANHQDFPISVPIGTQCLHAVGVAAAFHYRKQARVAVSVCGDGGTSEGDFYEALNLAGAWNLPVIFVVINNQWAISVPRSAQTRAETLAQKAFAAGFNGEQVDGNDIIAVHTALSTALARARQGEGPHLIEALTYRLHDHTTADDASRYRSKEELARAQAEEPIARLRHYLTAQGHWSDAKEQQLLSDCGAEVEQAVQAYFNLPLEPATAMVDYLYATLPHDLVAARLELESTVVSKEHG